MKKLTTIGLASLAALSAGGAQAASVSLQSVMNPDGFFSESAFTGSFAQIGLGDGSLGTVGALTGDNDGLYNLATFGDPNPQLFGGIDLFPRETNFEVGSVTYDDGMITGIGTEVVQIDSIDLSQFWSPDPGRLNGSPGTPLGVLSDISDLAIGLWFAGAPGEIAFGGLDANDTLTFVDGQLTSIDLEISTSFSVESFVTAVYSGTFSISGNEIAYLINDTQFGSTFQANLTGTVLAPAPIPVPPALVLLPSAIAALGFAGRRRKG